jgi:hypothetical protein
MRRQQHVRALPRAIGQKCCFLGGNLQHRRPEGAHKTVGIARAEAGPPAARYRDDRLVPAAAARFAESSGLRTVRRHLGERDRRIATGAAEPAFDAGRSGKAAVEQRQALDPSAVHGERCLDRIDAAQREALKLRFEADPAYLIGEPLAGLKIDRGAGAVESLLSVGAYGCADTLLHTLAPACLTGCCRAHHSTVIFAD